MKRRTLLWSVLAVSCGLGLVVLCAVPSRRQRWEEALADESPAVRAAAVRAMPRGGNEQLLMDALRDGDADVRLLTAQALGGQGPDGAERARAR